MNFFCVLCHAATFLLLGLKWHAKSIQHSSHKIKLGDFDGVARSEGALWRLPLLTLVLPSMAHAIFDYQEMAEKQDYYGLLVAPYILVVLMLAILVLPMLVEHQLQASVHLPTYTPVFDTVRCQKHLSKPCGAAGLALYHIVLNQMLLYL